MILDSEDTDLVVKVAHQISKSCVCTEEVVIMIADHCAVQTLHLLCMHALTGADGVTGLYGH